MQTHVLDATRPDSTLEETQLDAELFDIFSVLSIEQKKNLIGVVSSKLLRSIFVARQHQSLIKLHNIDIELSADAFRQRYLIAKLEALFLQDVVIFLDNAAAVIADELGLQAEDKQL